MRVQVHSSERRKSSAADGPDPTVVGRRQDAGPDAQAPCSLEQRAGSADVERRQDAGPDARAPCSLEQRAGSADLEDPKERTAVLRVQAWYRRARVAAASTRRAAVALAAAEAASGIVSLAGATCYPPPPPPPTGSCAAAPSARPPTPPPPLASPRSAPLASPRPAARGTSGTRRPSAPPPPPPSLTAAAGFALLAVAEEEEEPASAPPGAHPAVAPDAPPARPTRSKARRRHDGRVARRADGRTRRVADDAALTAATGRDAAEAAALAATVALFLELPLAPELDGAPAPFATSPGLPFSVLLLIGMALSADDAVGTALAHADAVAAQRALVHRRLAAEPPVPPAPVPPLLTRLRATAAAFVPQSVRSWCGCAEPLSAEALRSAKFEAWQLRRQEACAAQQRELAERAEAEAAAAPPVVLFCEGDADGPFACFSMRAPSPFLDSLGRSFASSLQCFYHRKALCFGDQDLADRILAEGHDPDVAERLGHQIEGYSEPRWRKYAATFASDAVRRKFSSNPEFEEALLSTGNAPLVAAGSAAWGLGLSLAECRALERDAPAEFGLLREESHNLLSNALEKERDRLAFRRRAAAHRGPLPYCCSAENGGFDFAGFAARLDLLLERVPLAERAVTCSATGARWQDDALVAMFKEMDVTGGVPANYEAGGGVLTEDRVCGSNARMTLDELVTAFRLLRDEEDKGQVIMYRTREELRAAGYDAVLVSPVKLVPKMSDCGVKLKAEVNLVTGLCRDGVHHPLMPQSRWIDDDSRETSKGAGDSVNSACPKEPCSLDDIPFAARAVMDLKSAGGTLSGPAKRRITGCVADIAAAYRNLPVAAADRRLHVFRFLDPTKPIPQYVIDGEQPRDEDCAFFVKQVLPFGWRQSATFSSGLARR